MVRSTRPTALQWVLLCALALAVLGMHHLTAVGTHAASEAHMPMPSAAASANATPMQASSSACCAEHPVVTSLSGQPAGHEHDMLHLCLAVLVAAGLTLAWLLYRHTRASSLQFRPRVVITHAGRDPPPPRRTSERLSSLCVLRL